MSPILLRHPPLIEVQVVADRVVVDIHAPALVRAQAVPVLVLEVGGKPPK